MAACKAMAINVIIEKHRPSKKRSNRWRKKISNENQSENGNMSILMKAEQYLS